MQRLYIRRNKTLNNAFILHFSFAAKRRKREG
jgi:hypothetical protein